jgi:hypothetical protein
MREPLGLEEILALPLRPCTACTRLVKRECERYGKIPEPSRECRCVHFVEKTP